MASKVSRGFDHPVRGAVIVGALAGLAVIIITGLDALRAPHWLWLMIVIVASLLFVFCFVWLLRPTRDFPVSPAHVVHREQLSSTELVVLAGDIRYFADAQEREEPHHLSFLWGMGSMTPEEEARERREYESRVVDRFETQMSPRIAAALSSLRQDGVLTSDEETQVRGFLPAHRFPNFKGMRALADFLVVKAAQVTGNSITPLAPHTTGDRLPDRTARPRAPRRSGRGSSTGSRTHRRSDPSAWW